MKLKKLTHIVQSYLGEPRLFLYYIAGGTKWNIQIYDMHWYMIFVTIGAVNAMG